MKEGRMDEGREKGSKRGRKGGRKDERGRYVAIH
jgi:hypothetical protein